VPNYEYSINDGVTYTAATSSTTYIFTGVSGSILPKVRDSRGVVVASPQIDCDIAVKFILLSVDGAGTGYITNSTGSNISSSFDVTQSYNSSYPVTASATSGSNLLGWTLFGSNAENNQFITTGSTYSHQFLNNNEIIYAAVKKPNTTTLTFCYYTGSTPQNTICSTCLITSSVYFNTSIYTGSGFNATWYKDTALSSSVDNGYYKILPVSGTTISNQIYSLTNGSSSLYGTCDSGSIYC